MLSKLRFEGQKQERIILSDTSLTHKVKNRQSNRKVACQPKISGTLLPPASWTSLSCLRCCHLIYPTLFLLTFCLFGSWDHPTWQCHPTCGAACGNRMWCWGLSKQLTYCTIFLFLSHHVLFTFHLLAVKWARRSGIFNFDFVKITWQLEQMLLWSWQTQQIDASI